MFTVRRLRSLTISSCTRKGARETVVSLSSTVLISVPLRIWTLSNALSRSRTLSGKRNGPCCRSICQLIFGSVNVSSSNRSARLRRLCQGSSRMRAALRCIHPSSYPSTRIENCEKLTVGAKPSMPPRIPETETSPGIRCDSACSISS